MPTIIDLRELHLKQLDVTLAESQILLQREGGLDGELKTSGAICEKFVRNTLKKYVVPGQFKISNGFIATPVLLRDHLNLPQCDILIVEQDTLPILRLDESEIEVIPRERVCGIIEVKRTLTRRSLVEALQHISTIVESIDEVINFKTDQELIKANRHIGFHNYSSDKPLLGIVALQNQIADFCHEIPQVITASDSIVDFIWSLDGYAMIPSIQNEKDIFYYVHTARPKTRTWLKLTSKDFHDAASPFYHQYEGEPIWSCLSIDEPGLSRASVFNKAMGVVSLMMSRVFTRPLEEDQIYDYYLRE